MVLGLRPHPRRLKTQQRAVGDRWRWNPLEHTRFACIQTGLVCTGSSVRPTVLWHIMSIRRQSTGLDRSLPCLAFALQRSGWLGVSAATATPKRPIVTPRHTPAEGSSAHKPPATTPRAFELRTAKRSRPQERMPWRLASPRLPLARLGSARLGSVATQCAPRMPLASAGRMVRCVFDVVASLSCGM